MREKDVLLAKKEVLLPDVKENLKRGGLRIQESVLLW